MQRRSGAALGSPSHEGASNLDRKAAGYVARMVRRSPVVSLLGLLLVLGSAWLLWLHANLPAPRAFLRGSRSESVDDGAVGAVAADSSSELLRAAAVVLAEKAKVAEALAEKAKVAEALAAKEASFPEASAQESNGLVRGALPAQREKYAEQREGVGFECFDKSKKFPSFQVVNDDYCDCPDGSDEPGTSACAGLKGLALEGFDCSWESGQKGPGTIIRLGSVNDGICDCCGGEDEWEGVVNCPNRCEELAAEAKQEASKAMEGSRAREAYVQRAAKIKGQSRFKDVDGGPEDVFLAAAEAGCLKLHDDAVEYEVCLFDKVSQHDRKSGQRFSLGKGGNWATTLWENGQQRKDYSALVMDGGDYCPPAHAGRKAEIQFECATKPALLSVQEAQVCVYHFRMQTPAACHSLQHHDD